jgi:hypothetical protein
MVIIFVLLLLMQTQDYVFAVAVGAQAFHQALAVVDVTVGIGYFILVMEELIPTLWVVLMSINLTLVKLVWSRSHGFNKRIKKWLIL